MGKKFEPARVRVKVPSRRWKSKAEVETWGRGQLAGGPPRLSAIVPEGQSDAGKPATWRHLQDGVLDGQFIVLESDPPGLIMHDSETGERKFIPSASRTGLVLGKTKADEFIGSIELERELRAFVRDENQLFNKLRQAEAERSSQNWTLEWHRHGRRIRQFVDSRSEVSTERIWQELVKWGRGENGYSRQTHQDSTYFYDWLGEVNDDHPVFGLSTTRIQHLLWADRTGDGRNRLLAAIVSGPLGNLSDDEFAWVVGKRQKNWPLDSETQEELASLGKRVRTSPSLTEKEVAKLVGILERVRERAAQHAAVRGDSPEPQSRT